MNDRLRTVLFAAPMLGVVFAAGAVLSPASGGAQTSLTDCDLVTQQVRATRAVMARFTPSGNSEVRYKEDALTAAAEAEAACAASTTTTTRPATTTTSAPGTTTTTRPATTTTTRPATTTTRPAATTTTTTAPPSGTQFPNQNTTGVPAGWTPAQVRTTSLRVTTPGAVIQDIRFDGYGVNLEIAAPNVIVRRVQLRGGTICNGATDGVCDGVPNGLGNGLVVEDSTIEPPPGRTSDPVSHWKIGPGGLTVRRTEVLNSSGGVRDGGKSWGMGPVVIEDSFFSIRQPNPCGDWHGEAVQGYDGGPLTVRRSTIDMEHGSTCTQGGGTAPFFYPVNQGNTSVDIDGLLIAGPNGNYSFRNGMPGRVVNLHIENNSWSYGPIDVLCSALSQWQADIVGPVARTAGGYQLPASVRAQPCNTQGGT